MAENVIYTAGDKKAIDDLTPDFAKGQGLLPTVVVDTVTKEVLMVAYMNQ